MSIYTRKEMAMLYDASKCTGCKGCQVACKQWNVLYSNLGMTPSRSPEATRTLKTSTAATVWS